MRGGLLTVDFIIKETTYSEIWLTDRLICFLEEFIIILLMIYLRNLTIDDFDYLNSVENNKSFGNIHFKKKTIQRGPYSIYL